MDTKAKKAPNPVDSYVGQRVRMRRMMINLSQEKLGEKIGVTFQQIQKYEKGTNRIGSSRLQQIAGVLGVPVAFFFDGAPQPDADGKLVAQSPAFIGEFLASADGVKLAKAFNAIEDGGLRHRIVALVEAVARGADDGRRSRLDRHVDRELRSQITLPLRAS